MKPHSIAKTLLSGVFLTACAGTASAISIVNGDFEAGNTGFSSGYTYVSPGSNALQPPSVYTVDTNPNTSHPSFYSMGDHTNGTGKMMIVNGDDVGGKTVWSGTADTNLTVGDIYAFSFWVASVYPDSPALLEALVTLTTGDQHLGYMTPTSGPAGNWTQFSGTFTATASSSLPTGSFGLLNLNLNYSGNDFALDDIEITKVGSLPVPDGGMTLALLGASLGGLAFVRRKLA
ncbi:MAG: VPDSG-CTERM sorting domain-containing protein [Akkermansiaceae bacterium]|nr:VPDSG-CTERM sorting domain-containing protein [Akkermansiaceae bacterium]MCF7731278.1 VPDSG-CTERM sorting domain-containing protein [Akkermansiaceae bacterium]